MTVNSIVSGRISSLIGSYLSSTGGILRPGTRVLGGMVGTYILSSLPLSAGSGISITLTGDSGSCQCTATWTTSSKTLTVTAVSSGYLQIGYKVTVGTGLVSRTIVAITSNVGSTFTLSQSQLSSGTAATLKVSVLILALAITAP